MHELLTCNINIDVLAHARGVDVSLRDVTIARDGKRAYRVRVTSRTGSAQHLENLKKVRELRLDTGRDGWLSLARGSLGQVSHKMGWGQMKKPVSKDCVSLSPYVDEPLNSKVIKSFVPEQRSRKCFSCFEIPMFYVIYLMNIPCTFRIFMYMAMVQWLNVFKHGFTKKIICISFAQSSGAVEYTDCFATEA